MKGRTLLRRIRVLCGLGAKIVHARLLGARMPIFVGLYITNACNLRCQYCFVNVDQRFDDPKRRGFTKEEILSLVDELHKMGTRWIFLLGGEPLVHPEIAAIVRHIVDKGILLHILSNGTLIERKIDAIDAADGVCVSIDGGEEATDRARGRGAYARALRGAEVALSRGMQVRVHAVLNRYSLGDMEELAKMADERGFTLTLSPLNHLGCGENPGLSLSDEEYRQFYQRYRALKERGYPIGNSFYAIDKAASWPIGYHRFIGAGEAFPTYDPIPCVIGHTHGCIDAEGIMFNCIQRGCLDGLNIRDVGIQRAWDELLHRRTDCVSCASINTIETSAYLSLRPEIIRDGLGFFFGHRKRRVDAHRFL